MTRSLIDKVTKKMKYQAVYLKFWVKYGCLYSTCRPVFNYRAVKSVIISEI